MENLIERLKHQCFVSHGDDMHMMQEALEALQAKDNEIAMLREAIKKSESSAHSLECMLLSNAKSDRAYDKMERLAEYIRKTLRQTFPGGESQ